MSLIFIGPLRTFDQMDECRSVWKTFEMKAIELLPLMRLYIASETQRLNYLSDQTL